MVFAKGTAGVYEIEPSMRWNPAVVAGVGMIRDPRPLYNDMHAYLASAGEPTSGSRRWDTFFDVFLARVPGTRMRHLLLCPWVHPARWVIIVICKYRQSLRHCT